MLTQGAKITIVKGCRARGVNRHVTAEVTEVTSLGVEYGYSVKVAFRTLNGMGAGKTFTFYARHVNRLTDPIIGLNDGNPMHTIRVRVR